jgi:hypothetical protein
MVAVNASQSSWRRWAPVLGSGHTAPRSRGEAVAYFKGRRPMREMEGSHGVTGSSFWTEQREYKGRGSRLGVPHKGEGEGGPTMRALEPGGIDGQQRAETTEAGGGRASRGGALGGSIRVPYGPCLENMGQLREKGHGPSLGKECWAATVN